MHPDTRERCLQIRTYNVIPLTPDVGTFFLYIEQFCVVKLDFLTPLGMIGAFNMR